MESQSTDAQKLEQIAKLTHDFNNALGVILGYSEKILDTLPPEDPLRSAVEIVLKAANKGIRLTNQVVVLCQKDTE